MKICPDVIMSAPDVKEGVCATQPRRPWQTLKQKNIMSKSRLIELHQAPANKPLPPTPTPPILPVIMAELVSQQDLDWQETSLILLYFQSGFQTCFCFFYFFSQSPSFECISCSPGPCKAHAICIRPFPYRSAQRCVILCFNLWSSEEKKLADHCLLICCVRGSIGGHLMWLRVYHQCITDGVVLSFSHTESLCDIFSEHI